MICGRQTVHVVVYLVRLARRCPLTRLRKRFLNNSATGMVADVSGSGRRKMEHRMALTGGGRRCYSASIGTELRGTATTIGVGAMGFPARFVWRSSCASGTSAAKSLSPERNAWLREHLWKLKAAGIVFSNPQMSCSRVAMGVPTVVGSGWWLTDGL